MKHSIEKMRACLPLLPAPGEEVFAECLDEIESLRQQLSAALAACKLKDEELEKIRGHIGLYNLFSCVGSDSYDPECADLNAGKCREIATKALAIQPDDSALKAWLGEPVAWLHEKRRDSDVITDAVKNVWNGVVVGEMAQYSIPLYAKPKGIS